MLTVIVILRGRIASFFRCIFNKIIITYNFFCQNKFTADKHFVIFKKKFIDKVLFSEIFISDFHQKLQTNIFSHSVRFEISFQPKNDSKCNKFVVFISFKIYSTSYSTSVCETNLNLTENRFSFKFIHLSLEKDIS